MDSSDQLQHFLGQRGEKDPPLAVHQKPQVQKKKNKILKETSASAGLPLSKQVLYIVLCPVYEACLFLKPWSSSRSWWTTAHNTRGSDFYISEDAVFRCKETFEQAETQATTKVKYGVNLRYGICNRKRGHRVYPFKNPSWLGQRSYRCFWQPNPFEHSTSTKRHSHPSFLAPAERLSSLAARDFSSRNSCRGQI